MSTRQPKRRKLPSYRLHRASGQALVTLDGRDFYLGPHGPGRSHDEYDRLIAEWLANGRAIAPRRREPTVNEAIRAFLRPGEDTGMVEDFNDKKAQIKEAFDDC